MTNSRSRAAALLLATFVAGALVGGAVIGLAERRDDRHGAWRPRHGSEEYLQRLTEGLELTSVQRDSVRAILDRHRDGMESLWREIRPRFETLRDSIRSEIRSQLTPEQRDSYAELLRRHDEERRNMMEGKHDRD